MATVVDVEIKKLTPHPWEKEIFKKENADSYEKLKADLKERGLRTPIHITDKKTGELPAFTIIAGHRRVKIALELGWNTIAATTMDFESEVGVHEHFLKDNVLRRELDNFERVETFEKLLVVETLKAKERERLSGGQGIKGRVKLPDLNDGRAADKAAEQVGASRRTMENDRRVVEYIKSTGDKELETLFRADRVGSGTILKQIKQKELIDRRTVVLSKEQTSNIVLLLGDATKQIAALKNASIDCIVTDPPYGLETNVATTGGREYFVGSQAYGDGEHVFKMLDVFLLALKPKLKENAHLWIFSSTKMENSWQFYNIIKKHFDVFPIQLVWDTGNATVSDYMKHPARRHEGIFFAKNGDGRLLSAPVTPTVLAYSKTSTEYHPAQKPVELLKFLINDSTIEGETVCDPFMGSGSTGVAAIQLKRKFVGIELDEKYYKISQARISEVL
jgi:site-specific DNA-methyltransferase (adenine-specific)